MPLNTVTYRVYYFKIHIDLIRYIIYFNYLDVVVTVVVQVENPVDFAVFVHVDVFGSL